VSPFEIMVQHSGLKLIYGSDLMITLKVFVQVSSSCKIFNLEFTVMIHGHVLKISFNVVV